MTTALPGPSGWENLRRMREIFSDPASALDRLSQSYGPICGLGLPGVRLVVIGGPAVLQEMFAQPADAFQWGHRFNVIGVQFVVGKESMIVSDGADHRRRRGSVQAAFTRRRLDQWVPMIAERADAAIDELFSRPHLADRPEDLTPFVRRLIIGVTVHAFFGARLAERADEIADLYEGPQHFIEAPAVKQLPHPLPFTTRARVRRDLPAINAMIDVEIAARRANPPGDPLAPEVWQRVREEADTVLGSPAGSAHQVDAASLDATRITGPNRCASIRIGSSTQHPSSTHSATSRGSRSAADRTCASVSLWRRWSWR